MRVPLEISFRGVEKSPAIEEFIRTKVAKLQKVCDFMISCRIVVEQPQQHQRSGSSFRVRIDMRVPPGHELVVRRESGEGNLHDSLRKVLKSGFDAARRQLQSLVERERGETKTHPAQERQAVVVRLFRDEGYGFIETTEGQELYFHRNSVLHDEFENLRVGTGVRFVEEMGEDGPQASTVQITDKPGSPVEELP